MPLFRLDVVTKILIIRKHNSVFCVSFKQKIDYFRSKDQFPKILLFCDNNFCKKSRNMSEK